MTKKDGIPRFTAAHARDVVRGTKDVAFHTRCTCGMRTRGALDFTSVGAIERLGADLARGHKDEICFLF